MGSAGVGLETLPRSQQSLAPGESPQPAPIRALTVGSPFSHRSGELVGVQTPPRPQKARRDSPKTQGSRHGRD